MRWGFEVLRNGATNCTDEEPDYFLGQDSMKNITHQVLVTVTPSKAFLAKLNKQSRSNRAFKAIAVIAAGCAILSEIERRKLEEQVYQLSIRVKKLERSEEE